MAYVDYSAAFAYKDLLTYQKLNQLGANDEWLKLFTTVAWTSYSASSTVNGFSGTPTVVLYYKKIGNLVFIQFDISGTSNATGFTFTIPYTCNALAGLNTSWGYGVDNGTVLTTPGVITLAANGTTVNIYKNSAGGAWTNSGAKQAIGQFWYESA